MSQRFGLRVVALAGVGIGQNPAAPIGQWLRSADVEAHEGRGVAYFTEHPAQAMPFATVFEAHAFWQASPTSRPLREDGEPNRPLTAFTVEIKELP